MRKSEWSEAHLSREGAQITGDKTRLSLSLVALAQDGLVGGLCCQRRLRPESFLVSYPQYSHGEPYSRPAAPLT